MARSEICCAFVVSIYPTYPTDLRETVTDGEKVQLTESVAIPYTRGAMARGHEPRTRNPIFWISDRCGAGVRTSTQRATCVPPHLPLTGQARQTVGSSGVV